MPAIEHCDVCVIGGGPAGQAAALVLDGLSLDVVVVDEQARPGGQILRQPPAEFRVPNWLAGREYTRLKAQLARFEKCGARWLGRHGVVEVRPEGDGYVVLADGAEGMRAIHARYLLVAAGCQDLAVPLPGWTLPGVYAAGGIQAFIKSQQIVPGESIVLAGTHPLQLMIAAQIVEAGGNVAAVLFAQPRGAMLRTLTARPAAALGHLHLLTSAAGAMRTLRRVGVPVRHGAALVAIEGEERVQAARLASGEAIACDTVGLNYGFVPQSVLPRMLGAAMRAAGPAGGFAAVHDGWMRASVPGLWVAGETTGVKGAPAAMAEGVLAGLGIALACERIGQNEAERRAAPARARHRRLRGFAALLDAVADPRPWFPPLATDTLVCRCEDVTCAEVRDALDMGSADSIKRFTRCGMGPCQGRNCEPSLLRMLADAGRGDDRGFAQRFPARPIPVADLADPA